MRWEAGAALVSLVIIALAVACLTPPAEPLLAAHMPGDLVAPLPDVVIHATGDVNLEAPGRPFAGVRSLFTRDDLSIVNLECAAGNGGVRQSKQYTFRCDQRTYPGVAADGVDVANQANNHSEDFGVAALRDGDTRLERAGIAVIGEGRDIFDANTATLLPRRLYRIAVIGFSGVVPNASWFASPSRPGLASGYDATSMAPIVREAKAEADVVIVVIHWGIENRVMPDASQIARAHALIDAGADMVFGSHPHVLQPLEMYKGRPIFYSLGDFVWPSYQATAVAEVRITPQKRFVACLLPAVTNDGVPHLTGATRC